MKLLLPVMALAAATLCAPPAPAENNKDAMQTAAKRLAERVAAIPGLHGPLRLEWHPDEMWPEGESLHWKEILTDALEARALNLTEEATAPSLALYAEETPTQVVLTARTQIADLVEIRIVAVSRASLPPSELPVAPVRLERQLIYESPDRILDAASLGNAFESGLAVLIYRNFEVIALRVDASGVQQQAVSLNAANLKPLRDPRAEMTPHGKLLSIRLWGKECEFSWETPDSVKCRAEKSEAYAKFMSRGETVLASPCDESDWTLSNSGNEPNTRAMLQAIPEGAVRESSAAVLSEFPGPILNTSVQQDSGSALVVARNLRTGNYEVYKVTLACGN